MKLYIDKEHFKALAMSRSSEHFANCLKMLQQDCDIVLTFAKHEIPNIGKKQERLAAQDLIKQLQVNRGKSAPVAENGALPSFENTEENFEKYTSLYFVDSPNTQKGLICPPVGEEVKALSSLYVGNRYIPAKMYYTPDMRDWSVIEQDAISCTDIIITDQYLFAQSDIHYQKNAYDLICSLCKKSVDVKVNIVIFTLDTYKDGDTTGTVNFTSIARNLKSKVEKVTNIEPNITFVKLPIREEHDRNIFINYKSFSSGDSFKYFIERGGEVVFVSNGRYLYANTHIDRDIHKISKRFIEDLQKIVDGRVKGLNSIIGDKKSNFLQFS